MQDLTAGIENVQPANGQPQAAQPGQQDLTAGIEAQQPANSPPPMTQSASASNPYTDTSPFMAGVRSFNNTMAKPFIGAEQLLTSGSGPLSKFSDSIQTYEQRREQDEAQLDTAHPIASNIGAGLAYAGQGAVTSTVGGSIVVSSAAYGLIQGLTDPSGGSDPIKHLQNAAVGEAVGAVTGKALG